MSRSIIYLASTSILVFETLAGAVMDIAHLPYVVQDVRSIGYPIYVLYIIGVWKILAVAALLWPQLPRLREWAYAGVFFEMSGATASHILAGDPLVKYAVPLCFSLLTLVSWWFQPDRETPPGSVVRRTNAFWTKGRNNTGGRLRRSSVVWNLSPVREVGLALLGALAPSRFRI